MSNDPDPDCEQVRVAVCSAKVALQAIQARVRAQDPFCEPIDPNRQRALALAIFHLQEAQAAIGSAAYQLADLGRA